MASVSWSHITIAGWYSFLGQKWELVERTRLTWVGAVLEQPWVDLDGDESESVGQHLVLQQRRVVVDKHLVDRHRRHLTPSNAIVNSIVNSKQQQNGSQNQGAVALTIGSVPPSHVGMFSNYANFIELVRFQQPMKMA